MSESNNPKPLSDRIFLIIMTKYDVLSNKVNPVWKRITKLDSDYQIVARTRFGAIVLFPCVYLYIILHRLSEHNFEYLKACTKEKEAKYIDLFIIEPCWFYDVACVVFLLLLLIDFGQKLIKRYKITNNQFVFLLVLELSYYVVRGQSWNDYTLTHFERWTSLYYADVIWLLGLYLIFFKWLMRGMQTLIKCLSDTLVAKKEKLTYKSPISNATPENILTENNNQGFQQSVNTDTSPSINKGIKGLLYDKKSKDDTLHRKPFAEQLANRILATNNPEGSVAVAVTGEWASGKSTFLSYIKEYLEGKAIIIDMNPGATESKRLLVKDFFDTIAEELQSYDAAVSELVYDYVDSLLEVHENGIIKVLKKVFAFNKTNSTKERFKTLSGCIKQLHQPLIIFIDDLDRLDKKETKEVLRLIRNTANFSNVIYIVAFDKDYVIAQIKTAHDETGKYLDKLFQLEVSLPFYESNKITDYLFKVLEERFGDDYKEDIILLKNEQTLIGDFVKSYREVHRLVNSFSVMRDCFDKLDFCDLFLLEIVRLKHYDIYEFIHDSGSITNILLDEARGASKKELTEINGIITFWGKRNSEDSTVGMIRDVKSFYRYFRLRYSEDELDVLELLKKLYNNELGTEALYSEIGAYKPQKMENFVLLAIENVQPREHIKLEFSQFEKTFEIFHKLYLDYVENYQYWEKNKVQNPTNPRPVNFKALNAIITIIDRILDSDREDYKSFLVQREIVPKLLRLVNQLLDSDYSSRNPFKFKRLVLFLQEQKAIESSFSELSKKYIKFYFEFYHSIKDCWQAIEEFVQLSTEFVSFKDELEECIYRERRDLWFFIKHIYCNTSSEAGVSIFKLRSEFINKVWGDEASFKQAIKDKEGNCTADIKPILQQLSTLLNESRPITEEVLKEEQYQELRLLEKEDEE